MDTLNMLGTFLNIVAIAFAVVCVLIAIGLITAIIMLVKKVKPSGKGTLPTRRRKASPHNQRNSQLNRQSRHRSHFRTRRTPV